MLVYSLQTTVYCNGEAIATGVFVGFGNTFTYLYGASDYEHRSLMAPYLVQWEGMKMGKKLGYSLYDWFGIAPRSLNCHSDPPRAGKNLCTIRKNDH